MKQIARFFARANADQTIRAFSNLEASDTRDVFHGSKLMLLLEQRSLSSFREKNEKASKTTTGTN